MHRSVIFLATLAVLLAVNGILAMQQTGDVDVPEENRPKLNNSDSAGSDKKKREMQIQDDGVTVRLETPKGKRVDIALAFFAEVQADGTPVAGDSAMIRVDKESGEREKLKITPPEDSEDIDKEPLSEEKLDPDRRLGRRTTPPPTAPPMMPPLRRRRAATEDTDQNLDVDEIKQQSVSTEFDFDKRDENRDGARVQFKITGSIIESEGDVSIGTETLHFEVGYMKIQVDITDYEFCGDGGRECLAEDLSPTVGKALKVCFEHKGSSGESDNVKKETRDDENKGDKFTAEDGEITYSRRVIVDDEIFVLAEEDVIVEDKNFVGKTRHFVCVSLPRPDSSAVASFTYDPTGSADDDEEDEDTTESGATRVTFPLISWALAAILKLMF